MKKHFKRRTVLIFAHQLRTLKNVDKIMVIEEVCIIEYGSAQELEMQVDGKYAARIQIYRLL